MDIADVIIIVLLFAIWAQNSKALHELKDTPRNLRWRWRHWRSG